MSQDSQNVTMQALKAAMKARMPVVLVGDPGTGKTEVVRSIAEQIGYELITVVGSQMDPTDITGLPKGEKIAEDENGDAIWGTVYLSPWWQVRALRHKKVIIFLDELSNSPAAVRASMLTFLQNRELPNGTKLPDETIVVAAMNPPEQAADGYELDLPTTNRLFFIPWSPTQSSWYEGMLTNWGRPAPAGEMAWKKKIVGFIKDNPSYLHTLPAQSGADSTVEAVGVSRNDLSEMAVYRYAWPSRRSWDNLSRVLSQAGTNDVSVLDFIAQGVVGYSAAAAFRDWLRRNDTIRPEDVMEDPASVDWATISLNDSNLVLRALIEMVSDETSDKVIDVFVAVAEAKRFDLGGAFMRDLLKALMDGKKLSRATIESNRERGKALAKMYQEVLVRK